MRPLIVLALAALTGCTVINTASVPSDRSGRDLFVTAGEIPEPYESLGVVQATRSGVLLFGVFDVMGTDLETGFNEVLIPLVRELGGDGAINVRFHQTQYLPLTRVLGAVFFIFPLPSQVTMTAEVVRLKHGAGDRAPRAGAAPGVAR